MCYKKKQILIVALVVLLSTFSFAFSQDVKLHGKGKQHVRKREWGKAVEIYRELLLEYPDSRYADDALFWIGFSQEKITGKEEDAFSSFQGVIDAYPRSPWVDDAKIHQISLAKNLLRNGKEKFREFLLAKIADADTSIRYQAAIALGEFKDPNVLPLLEEMAMGKDAGFAAQAIDILRGYSKTLEETIGVKSTVSGEDHFPEKESEIVARELNKKGEHWTVDELLLNGLYHIVSDEDLTFFLTLENEWDRREWWRKFWAEKDPTPTTPENEALEEFERRVIFAYQNFGKEWQFKKRYYPPWDSRGEIYVKYGKPDRRDVVQAGWEEWTYHNYRLILMVSSLDHNRTGKGVYLGTVTRYLNRPGINLRRDLGIRDPQFVFHHPYSDEAKNLKDLEFKASTVGSSGEMIGISFVYRFPVRNLRFVREGDHFIAAYNIRWVLYDEDYRQIQASEEVKEVLLSEETDLNEIETLGEIPLTLVPGSYSIGLRIEDTRSNRVGIYRKNFTLQNKK